MAGAPPRYSEQQREAVIAHVIDRGHSAAAALELAKSGKLAGLPAFSPSYDQVTEWVRQRRRDILATTPPETDDYHAISRRLWAQHVAEVDRLERDLRKKKRTDAEKDRLTRQLTETIKRHREARALLAATPPNTDQPPAPKEEPKGLFDRLAASPSAGESEGEGGEREPTDNQNDSSEAATDVVGDQRPETDNDSNSAPADASARPSAGALAAAIRGDLQTESVDVAA